MPDIKQLPRVARCWSIREGPGWDRAVHPAPLQIAISVFWVQFLSPPVSSNYCEAAQLA